MAIIKKKYRKRVIDLSGPEGNAFVLLGIAEDLSKQLEFPNYTQKEIQDEMKSGDYDNLIKTFDKYFGDYVDLEIADDTQYDY